MSKTAKIAAAIATAVALVIAAILISGWIYFGPPGKSADTVVFTVPENRPDFDPAVSLKNQGLIKNSDGFRFLKDKLAKNIEVKPGGYNLRKNMYAWEVINKLTGKPDLLWVTISGCPRKEQIGEKLAATLGWDAKTLNDWNTLYSDIQNEYFEGVYYPDTYLLPVTETAAQIARRFIARFQEKFAPFSDKYLAANIKWTTGLKIASLIAREAAGQNDMYLISGIIWNRLNAGMPLQIDATMQYTQGKRPDGSWWGPVDLAEKQKDSPYNTYIYKGLPPTPICSPDIGFTDAALNPEPTDCLYYLHDSRGVIHCARTYTQHKQNITKYLD
jgi:UPF0755 protein